MDRMSGSGVFARDADAIIDFSNLVMRQADRDRIKEVVDPMAEDIIPLRMEMILRSFRSPKPLDMFFLFPLHEIDAHGWLAEAGAAIEGTAEANRMLSPNGGKTEDEMKAIIDEAFDAVATDGSALFADMAKHTVVSDKTLQGYLDRFPDDYSVKKVGKSKLVTRKK